MRPFAAPERLTVADAFQRHAEIDLLATIHADGTTDREALAVQMRADGLSVSADDTWADLFSKVIVGKVEPHLGMGRATILCEYPTAEAALARRSPKDARVAERFELYACGVELANAFGELTDAAEQRRRFEMEMAEKARIYGERYPLDEDFLKALTIMPEASGIALGFDRWRCWLLARGGSRMSSGPRLRSSSHDQGRRFAQFVDDLAMAGSQTPSPALEAVAARYAVAVTPEMAALIERAGPDSAMARQFVPDARELDTLPEESADPISDRRFTPIEGVVHRYPDRVLLKAVHVCPVYCRFCFRREMVGPAGDGLLAADKLDAALAYIRAHEEIWEVILTGGDPLVLSPRRLERPPRAAERNRPCEGHPHPFPRAARRSGTDFRRADCLARATGKTVYVALHANHPDEFTDAGRKACARLVDAGIAMVSQSVLLRGVNDDAEVLAKLMRTFVENRIKPYYLHHRISRRARPISG